MKNDFFGWDFQNDGSFKGRRYFSCPKGKGIFVMETKILRKFSKKTVDDDDKKEKEKVIKVNPTTPVFGQSLLTLKTFFKNKKNEVSFTIQKFHCRLSFSRINDECCCCNW